MVEVPTGKKPVLVKEEKKARSQHGLDYSSRLANLSAVVQVEAPVGNQPMLEKKDEKALPRHTFSCSF